MKFTIHDNIDEDQFRSFVEMHRTGSKVTEVTIDEKVKACVVDGSQCYMFASDTKAAGKVAARVLVK